MAEFKGTLIPPKLASAPGSPTEGQVYYDTVTHNQYMYNGTSWIPVQKTFFTTHTWAIGGEIKVAVADNDFIPPFFVLLDVGQPVELAKCRYKINSGTSVTAKLTRNGSDITGFTGMSITTTANATDPTDVALTDGDAIALVVTAVSGTPLNLSFTLALQHHV